jgi:hypothetical protein
MATTHPLGNANADLSERATFVLEPLESRVFLTSATAAAPDGGDDDVAGIRVAMRFTHPFAQTSASGWGAPLMNQFAVLLSSGQVTDGPAMGTFAVVSQPQPEEALARLERWVRALARVGEVVGPEAKLIAGDAEDTPRPSASKADRPPRPVDAPSAFPDSAQAAAATSGTAVSAEAVRPERESPREESASFTFTSLAGEMYAASYLGMTSVSAAAAAVVANSTTVMVEAAGTLPAAAGTLAAEGSSIALHRAAETVASFVEPPPVFEFATPGAPFTLLMDSVAAFIEDSASLSAAAAVAQPPTTGPWTLTFVVIATDVVLLSYVYRKRRRGDRDVKRHRAAATVPGSSPRLHQDGTWSQTPGIAECGQSMNLHTR